MPLELLDVVGVRAEVAVEDVLVAAAGAEEHVRPGEGADARLVPGERGDLLELDGVVDLDVAEGRADGEVVAARVPGDGGGLVGEPEVAELDDLVRGGAPEVDAGRERDGEHVLARPVDEVQVEVVLQGGRVEHLEGDLRDLARLLVLHARLHVLEVELRDEVAVDDVLRVARARGRVAELEDVVVGLLRERVLAAGVAVADAEHVLLVHVDDGDLVVRLVVLALEGLRERLVLVGRVDVGERDAELRAAPRRNEAVDALLLALRVVVRSEVELVELLERGALVVLGRR